MADKSKKKGSKKGGKKVDPFTRKEWYSVKAPTAYFARNQMNTVGYTPVNRTQGTKLASDGLKGRVFEVCLADMKQDESHVFRKIKLRADDVEGKNVLTNFYGMDVTSDKLRSLVHKWATLIECFVDVKTTDGYTLRVFAITFTKKAQKQLKKTSYAKSSKVKLIRKKMFDIINSNVTSSDIGGVVNKFIDQTISAQIQKECSYIFPLTNTYIRKVKVMKSPKFEIAKLLELYQNAPSSAPAPVVTEETGVAVERTEETTA
ncbi:40S ribosomal protein S3a [Heterostelium album PN500]|uniref:Small ribosomal subunit protein eS1 n=1 Tax=Heterostelium pallidum (strain ATCC 26659 / Pp 5 / PN500) TaxID=670386 RepID=D3BEH6_HETP5|nr:40S ribosomal protein S3a [Heterostelium album PN500]EFA80307.1 40S ribosomal protein S3a [Heterostelium album PN500]|eukprot:XP_020432427.1 40S ribosomal protein S3a [Heterostelium album PN500]